jgi:hypothetical protein
MVPLVVERKPLPIGGLQPPFAWSRSCVGAMLGRVFGFSETDIHLVGQPRRFLD